MNRVSVLIAVMAVVTFALRAVPFFIFRDAERTPRYIAYLGEVLPKAAVGMLVVYCFREISFAAGSHGIPELAAGAAAALLQAWKRNMILSIIGATVLYMILIQVVFIG